MGITLRAKSLFSSLPDSSAEEWFDPLFERPGCRAERIVSKGHASPPGFWYDQAWDEWVLILKGSAVLRLEAQPDLIPLATGDSLMIPAHTRHRVESTHATDTTIWLALHFDGQVS